MELHKYAALFLAEAREHIAQINAALAALEREHTSDVHTSDGAEPTREPTRAASVDSIFRSVHTIKGMGAAMEYPRVSELAHGLETELDTARSEARYITPLFFTHIYEEIDALARAVEAAVAQAEESARLQDGHVEHRNPQNTATDALQNHPTYRSRTSERQIRINVSRLDTLMNLTGELETARGQLERAAEGAAAASSADAAKTGVINESASHHDLSSIITRVSRLIRELRDQVITARIVPVGQMFERFPRLVRETARKLGKDIDFQVEGVNIELDRSMLDAIGDPVLHLLRNAIDHGIEAADLREIRGKSRRGRVTLRAERGPANVMICVCDDGGGIDRGRVLDVAQGAGVIDTSVAALTDTELMDVLVQPGFSTADQLTDVSGRGVGLDVVHATVEALGGTLSVRSTIGEGTEITLSFPLTAAMLRAEQRYNPVEA